MAKIGKIKARTICRKIIVSAWDMAVKCCNEVKTNESLHKEFDIFQKVLEKEIYNIKIKPKRTK